MSFLSNFRLSRAPAAGLAIVGCYWGGIASLMPALKLRAAASDGELGIALLMAAAGGMVSMYFAPRVERHFGARALGAACLPILLAVLWPMLVHDVYGLGIALFVMGLSVALLDIMSNIRISALETQSGKSLMNFNHAMFSFGFGGSALLAGLARQAGVSFTAILFGIGVVSTLLAVLIWLDRPARLEQDAAPEDDIPDLAVPWAVILPTAVILFAAFITENAAETWSAVHIELSLGAAAGTGGFGPATLGLTMGVGRLVGQSLTDRFGAERLVLGSALLAAVGAVAIAVAPTVVLAVAGVACLGIGMAVVVPSANSMLGARVAPRLQAVALSRAWMVAFVGFFVGPSLMGGVAELFSLAVAFLMIAGLVTAIIPATLYLMRKPERVGAARLRTAP